MIITLEEFNELANSITESDKNKFYKFTPTPINLYNLRSHFFNANGITSDCLKSDIIIADRIVAKTVETLDLKEENEITVEDVFLPGPEEIYIYSSTFCLPTTGYCFPIDIDGSIIETEIKINNISILSSFNNVLPAGTVVSCNNESFEQWIYIPTLGTIYELEKYPTGPVVVYEYKDGVGAYTNSVMFIYGLIAAPGNFNLSIVIENLPGNSEPMAFQVPIFTVITDDGETISMKEPYHFKYSEGDDPEHDMYLSVSGHIWGGLTIEIEDRGVSN